MFRPLTSADQLHPARVLTARLTYCCKLFQFTPSLPSSSRASSWKSCGLLHAIPLMMVLPPRPRPERMV